MMTHRGGEVLAEPLTLGLTQRRRLFEARLSLLAQGRKVLPHVEELLLGLANQLDKDFALAPTAAAKTAHNFAEVVLEDFRLVLEVCVTATALLGDTGDEV
jgi:hypothetical protein